MINIRQGKWIVKHNKEGHYWVDCERKDGSDCVGDFGHDPEYSKNHARIFAKSKELIKTLKMLKDQYVSLGRIALGTDFEKDSNPYVTEVNRLLKDLEG